MDFDAALARRMARRRALRRPGCEADDLFQEAALGAYGRGQVAGLGIVHALRQFGPVGRRGFRRPPFDSLDEPRPGLPFEERLADDAPDPGEGLDRARLRRALARALAALPAVDVAAVLRAGGRGAARSSTERDRAGRARRRLRADPALRALAAELGIRTAHA